MACCFVDELGYTSKTTRHTTAAKGTAKCASPPGAVVRRPQFAERADQSLHRAQREPQSAPPPCYLLRHFTSGIPARCTRRAHRQQLALRLAAGSAAPSRVDGTLMRRRDCSRHSSR